MYGHGLQPTARPLELLNQFRVPLAWRHFPVSPVAHRVHTGPGDDDAVRMGGALQFLSGAICLHVKRSFEFLNSAVEIGLAHVLLPQQIGEDIADVVVDDQFRQAFLRLKEERRLYSESTDAITFLTPALFRGSIGIPAEAQIGTYDVDVKLFADGAMIARTNSTFEIAKVGFERFIAGSAEDHGLLYGIATAAMALMTGWFASIVFRRD